MPTIHIPDNYGYVLLTCGILPCVTNIYLSGAVVKARKRFDIKYPNLYATPGYHEHADEFNRVQRGHQHIFESLADFHVVSFIGGFKHPLTCAICGFTYCLGNYLYMSGYKDTKLDVKTARLKKGGPINMLSLLVSLGCAVSCTVSLIRS